VGTLSEVWRESDSKGKKESALGNPQKENPRRYPLDTEASIG